MLKEEDKVSKNWFLINYNMENKKDNGITILLYFQLKFSNSAYYFEQ